MTTEGEQGLNTDWKAPPSFTRAPEEGNIRYVASHMKNLYLDKIP